MRLIGLTLCLLASQFGARAESAEDRISVLEARVKALEEALCCQDAKIQAPLAVASTSQTLKGEDNRTR